MEEPPHVMVLHGLLITAALYIVMKHILGQAHNVAETRSVAFGLFSALYMVVFGHNVPPQAINPNLFK